MSDSGTKIFSLIFACKEAGSVEVQLEVLDKNFITPGTNIFLSNMSKNELSEFKWFDTINAKLML